MNPPKSVLQIVRGRRPCSPTAAPCNGESLVQRPLRTLGRGRLNTCFLLLLLNIFRELPLLLNVTVVLDDTSCDSHHHNEASSSKQRGQQFAELGGNAAADEAFLRRWEKALHAFCAMLPLMHRTVSVLHKEVCVSLLARLCNSSTNHYQVHVEKVFAAMQKVRCCSGAAISFNAREKMQLVSSHKSPASGIMNYAKLLLTPPCGTMFPQSQGSAKGKVTGCEGHGRTNNKIAQKDNA
jgi:hypothetical protein